MTIFAKEGPRGRLHDLRGGGSGGRGRHLHKLDAIVDVGGSRAHSCSRGEALEIRAHENLVFVQRQRRAEFIPLISLCVLESACLCEHHLEQRAADDGAVIVLHIRGLTLVHLHATIAHGVLVVRPHKQIIVVSSHGRTKLSQLSVPVYHSLA